MINEEQYSKAIRNPTARDLIQPDDALFQKAEELDIVLGDTKHQDKSKFISYAVAVEDTEDIQAAYVKLKMKFADATHISCAFHLPGANTPLNQDYIDDGEFGCGRVMLNTLKEEQYMNMAIFIVRYYGGVHLGNIRFDIFKKLATAVIKALMAKREAEATEQPSQEAVSVLPERFKSASATTDNWAEMEDWSTVKKSD